MPREIEITLLPNGGIMVERSDLNQNNLLRDLFLGKIEDESAFSQFLEMTDQAEIIFGDTTLCG